MPKVGAIKNFRELVRGPFITPDRVGDLARWFHPLRQILERIPVDSWPITARGLI